MTEETVPYKRLFLYGDPARLGIWTARAREEVTKDYNYYSKSWHRKYGPKVTVDARYVEFVSDKGQRRVVHLDSWRGNWRLNVLLKAGIVRPRKGMMHVRLHEACDIELVQESRSYRVYRRTVKGEFLDLCVVSPLGLTYHAETLAQCLKGLRLKRRALQDKQEGRIIDFDLLRKLGFCEPGIREFCSRFGYRLSDRVTPQAVYERISMTPERARPFVRELKILADYLNFNVPEFGASHG